MAGLELDTAEQWVYQILTANPTIAAAGVYNALADSSADRYVVFQFQGGTRLKVIGNVDVWSDLVYLVKVVDKSTSYSTSTALRAAITTTLDGAGGTTPDGTVFACIRENPIRYTEVSNGVQYKHAGDTWRLFVR